MHPEKALAQMGCAMEIKASKTTATMALLRVWDALGHEAEGLFASLGCLISYSKPCSLSLTRLYISRLERPRT